MSDRWWEEELLGREVAWALWHCGGADMAKSSGPPLAPQPVHG